MQVEAMLQQLQRLSWWVGWGVGRGGLDVAALGDAWVCILSPWQRAVPTDLPSLDGDLPPPSAPVPHPCSPELVGLAPTLQSASARTVLFNMQAQDRCLLWGFPAATCTQPHSGAHFCACSCAHVNVHSWYGCGAHVHARTCVLQLLECGTHA